MISNQMNAKATPVRKILDQIVDGQNRDIRLLTTGHLNESNLFKPPKEDKSKIIWENSQKPHILQRPPLLVTKTNSVNEKKNFDNLTEYSSGTPLHSKRITKSRNHMLSDVYVEELKLPDIIVAKPQTKLLAKSLSQPEKEKNQPTSVLPRVNESFPRSDAEMAYKIIHNPIGGSTKQDKFNNLKLFERDVIQIGDMTKSNILFDTDKNKYFENKLRESLNFLNINNENANFHRLQLHNNIFDEIIKEKDLFSDVLSVIKNEYDTYLNYLLDKQSQNSELIIQAQLMRSTHFDKNHDIRKLDNEIERLEKQRAFLKHEEIELRDKIKSEELFQIKKRKLNLNENSKSSIETNSYKSNSLNVFDKTYDISDFNSIGQKIEITKEEILEKLQEISNLNDVLNKDYVPLSVINNLTQTIKDCDVEIQKLVSQNGFLDDQINTIENELRNILIQNDNTEFKDENVEMLLKLIRNLEVMQKEKSNSSPNAKQIRDQDEKEEFCHTYDDYFS